MNEIKVAAVLMIIVIALAIVMMIVINKPAEIKEPNAKIAHTAFGCLETNEPISVFENKQAFHQEVLGYSYLRCEE